MPVPSRTHAHAALLIFLVATAVPTTTHSEETVLVFDKAARIVTIRPPEQGGTTADTSRVELIVTLGDRHFKVFERERAWVYDFPRRRVVSVDRDSKVFSEWSMYAFVAFNELELASRLGLHDGEAGTASRGKSVLELEALFSMPSTQVRPDPRESLVDSSRGDRARVLINGRLSTSAIPSGSGLSPARAAMFERFLLYRCHLHPQARRAVVALGKVPQVLLYRFQDSNQETAVLLTLKQATSAPEDIQPTVGCTRMDVSDPAFSALGARLRDSQRRCNQSARASWADASRRFESEALAHGRYLDAALTSIERAMGVCEKPSAWTWPAEIRERAEADSNVMAYIAATRWSDIETATKGVEKLEAIDRAGLEKGYMIDMAVAKARLARGDLEGGSRMLLAALAHYPCAVDAWVDLAGAYMRAYQTVLAWLCLDAARAVAPPGCPSVSDATDYERRLREQHPEYLD